MESELQVLCDMSFVVTRISVPFAAGVKGTDTLHLYLKAFCFLQNLPFRYLAKTKVMTLYLTPEEVLGLCF